MIVEKDIHTFLMDCSFFLLFPHPYSYCHMTICLNCIGGLKVVPLGCNNLYLISLLPGLLVFGFGFVANIYSRETGVGGWVGGSGFLTAFCC